MKANHPAAGQLHNPGYEHLKSIYYLKEAQAKAPLQAASAYILPLMALKNACLAIEAYVDRAGRNVDPAWDEADWQAASIRERVAYIYEKMGRQLSFEKDIWKRCWRCSKHPGRSKGIFPK